MAGSFEGEASLEPTSQCAPLRVAKKTESSFWISRKEGGYRPKAQSRPTQ
jgi:hypothetical protein